ncbi:hypothetical protein D3C75_866650 [compost metagenome]
MHLIEHIHDHDIILSQHINDPLIVKALSALFGSNRHKRFMKIGTCRHHHCRNCASDHNLIGMYAFEASLELKTVTIIPKRHPGFFKRDLSHALQNIIRHLGPAVLIPFTGPSLCPFDNIFLAVKHTYPSSPGQLSLSLFIIPRL